MIWSLLLGIDGLRLSGIRVLVGTADAVPVHEPGRLSFGLVAAQVTETLSAVLGIRRTVAGDEQVVADCWDRIDVRHEPGH